MKILLMTHEVTDFETWLGFHHEREELFQRNGVASIRTFLSPRDGNQVAMLVEVTDLDDFMAWLQTEEARQAKARHGVKDPITFYDEVISLNTQS